MRTATSNWVLTAPDGQPDVRDLHGEAAFFDGIPHVVSVWEPSPDERLRIAAGANVQVAIAGTTHAPLSLDVTDQQGVGEDSPEYQRRLRELDEARRRGQL